MHQYIPEASFAGPRRTFGDQDYAVPYGSQQVGNRVGCTGKIKPKSEWLYGCDKAKINVFKMELSFLYTPWHN